MKIVLTLIYPLFVALSLFWATMKIRKDHYAHHLFITSLIMGAFLLIVTLIYFKIENTIYFWDSSGQWSNLIYLKNAFDYNVTAFLQEVYQSICYTEYSKLPAFFLMLPIHFLGVDFSVFVLSMVAFFVIPTIWLINIFIFQIIPSELKNKKMIILLPICTFLFVPFIYSVFEGEAGVVGLFFIALLYLFLLQHRHDKVNILLDLAIAVVLVILIFIRRWYIFWILAYFIAELIFALVNRIYHRIAFQQLKNILINFSLIALISLIILFIGFRPYLQMISQTNYAEAYVAYRLPLSEQLLQTYNFYGIVVLTLCIAGVKSMLSMSSRWGMRLLLHIGLAVTLFSVVQSFDLHHYFIIAIEMGILCFFGVVAIFDYFKHKGIKSILIIVLICNFTYKMFFPLFPGKYLFGNLNNAPENRKDIPQLVKVVEEIKDIIKDDSIYIFASSLALNDQIMNNIYLPHKMNALEQRVPTFHIDERDGFPKVMFECQYILVSDPIQLHKDESHQKIIWKLSELLVIQANYEWVKEFEVGNIQLQLYRLTRPFTENEIKEIENMVMKAE